MWSDWSPVLLRLLAHLLYIGCIKENETWSHFSVIFTCFLLYFSHFAFFHSHPLSQTSKMGKKSRVKTQKSGTGATAAVSPKEMMNLISELLQSEYKSILYGCIPALKYRCNDFLPWMCASLLHKRLL